MFGGAISVSQSQTAVTADPQSDDASVFADVILSSDSHTHGPTRVCVKNVSWGDSSSYPPEKADVLLGSDLVYDQAILGVLLPAVIGMLADGRLLSYCACLCYVYVCLVHCLISAASLLICL